MINSHYQKGVGLMEVLVAMLILAIAILGYAALQVRATTATEESMKRSDALIILNGLAEKIRLNPNGDYKQYQRICLIVAMDVMQTIKLYMI